MKQILPILIALGGQFRLPVNNGVHGNKKINGLNEPRPPNENGTNFKRKIPLNKKIADLFVTTQKCFF